MTVRLVGSMSILGKVSERATDTRHSGTLLAGRGFGPTQNPPIGAANTREEQPMEVEEDNVHPVVRLLVARMESHPEEFDFDGHGYITNGVEGYDTQYRWEAVLARVKEWASGEDMAVLRKPYMDAIHRDALDELMNGPERRAEEERIRQEEHRRWMKGAQGTAGGVLGSVGIGNVAPSQGLTISTAGQEALRIRKPRLLDRVLDRLIK